MRIPAFVLLAIACVSWFAPRATAAGPADAGAGLLERIRRDPALARDPAAIDSLAHEAEEMPSGSVRVEARMLVAEAWLGRMQRPNDAIAELRLVVDDPSADWLTASLAERELVEALAADGKLAEASRDAHAHARIVDPRFLRKIERLVRRQWVKLGAVALLVSFGLLAGVALLRARQRGTLAEAIYAVRAIAALTVSFAVFVAFAGGALAARYESGSGRPFFLLGLVALPLVLAIRAWSAVGSVQRSARVARAVFCGATLLAAAFLVLDVVSPDYLEGFGL